MKLRLAILVLLPLLFLISTTIVAQAVSNLYINELMAANNIIADEFGETDDWVELYNANDTTLSLQGLFFSDDADDKTKWQIETPVLIPPNGFVLLWMDDAPEQGELHAPFKLSSSGESLFISQIQNGDLIVIDEITFGNVPQNISYGRTTDGEDSWVYFGEYSPDQSNDGNDLFLDVTVNFSIPGGFYDSNTPLSITCSDPDALIRITTDGSKPSVNSPLYSNDLLLDQTTLIRAAAFKPGYTSNGLKEEFYLINNDHELPVIQITIDRKYLWDDEEGMYVTGTNGIPGNCSGEPRNWNQNWERPASIRYFEPDGEEAFRIKAGMKIGGGCSRGFSMKPFNVFLREDEYGDEQLVYPFFDNLEVTEFKRFKLRASGNDFSLTRIRDAAIQSILFNKVDLDQMAYQPVVLYLNGEYWGFYGVRELFNKHYLEAHHGVNKDSLDFLKNPYIFTEVKEGDKIAWDDLTNFIRNNSLSGSINYNFVTGKIDINEYINYNISQLYIANYDWPGNNTAVWRTRNNGKWRWMLYDTDISSGYGQWSPALVTFNAIDHATTTLSSDWPNWEASTLFLRKLLYNKSFKEEFTQRACTFAQVIFAPERCTHIIDSLSSQVASEIPKMFNKFNNAPPEWNLWGEDPVGGNLSNWQSNLYNFKSFFNRRFEYMLAHYEGHFGYTGHFKLHINVDQSTPGTVVLHENEMSIHFQYSGDYFNNVPILLKAIPNPGYYFLRWKETGDTTATIHFQTDENSMLTPLFLKDGEVEIIPEPDPESLFQVFPIPAKTELALSYGELETSPFTIRVFNVIGQLIHIENLVAETIVQQHFIDVRKWAAGVYFLETKIGETSILKRIVVE